MGNKLYAGNLPCAHTVHDEELQLLSGPLGAITSADTMMERYTSRLQKLWFPQDKQRRQGAGHYRQHERSVAWQALALIKASKALEL